MPEIRPIEAGDYDQWKTLFAGYCDFYHEPCDAQKCEVVWAWLTDPSHMLTGLVAEDDEGRLAGLAHYHAWPISLFGSDVCYLSDLFVDPTARQHGTGKALYEHLLNLSKENGWSALTLLTQKDNQTARKLYDRYGESTDFRFYLTPTQTDKASVGS